MRNRVSRPGEQTETACSRRAFLLFSRLPQVFGMSSHLCTQ